MPPDRSCSKGKKPIFCTACKTIKELDQFDGHQLSKRFGIKKCAEEDEKRVPTSYDAEAEKMQAMERRRDVRKIWCRPCSQKTHELLWTCSDCEQRLPRAKFAQAQLSKHKSDEDRLCKDCADLTMQKVEAVRVGEEYEADEIEKKLKNRREAGGGTQA
ncbi:hypothetical protein PCANC_03610 [Puccinia coronata f. sp. avenae]|uniref:Stc1 domain-containing protein n=1 Tax=Puccinia coronata f. sp. avenae TaxID=200324 RepID=A0A2N5T2I7_9BASI|nr:hypothetical protein PCANC_07160 [Puccinia coronata f. sp. avenae]PLW19703.1 hypothetical protein PCASD_13173 [Puccinia coronata f. sp. avenae]PLW31866.1 hypothetical protein PCASD_13203 [Puccinia coronata f. sp. avenae]PLW53796.1 hypothetical protein PCANC_03610 [Puccinia coronata f. sp. avenae]